MLGTSSPIRKLRSHQKTMVKADITHDLEPVAINTWDMVMGAIAIYHTLVFREGLDPAVLQDSLREALAYFPVFAGRLRRTKDKGLEAVCNNAGVSFNVVSCSNTLQDFVPRPGVPVFVPQDMSPVYRLLDVPALAGPSPDFPLLAIILLQLSGGGCCLVMGISHAVADHYSFRLLMAHWAAATRNLTQANPTASNPHPQTPPATLDIPSSTNNSSAGTHPQSPITPSSEPQHLCGHPSDPPFERQRTPPKPYPSPSVLSHASPTVADCSSIEDLFHPSSLTELLGNGFKMVWHFMIRDHISSLMLHVSKARLAELKAEATEQLQKLKTDAANTANAVDVPTPAAVSVATPAATPSPPGAASSPWISTNDALVARLWQLLGSSSAHANKAFPVTLAVNMRPRLQLPQPDVLGNWVNIVKVPEQAAGSAPLGHLAALIRNQVNGVQDRFVQTMTYISRLPKQQPLGIKTDFFSPGGWCPFTNWDWQVNELDFGVMGGAPAIWSQGVPSLPFVMNMISSAADGDGVWVHLRMHSKVIRELKARLAAGEAV